MFETFFIGRCRWSWDRFLLSGFCGRSRCFCLLSCCRCGGFGTGFWCLLFVCCCSFCKLEVISNHYFFVIDDNKQCPDCEARHETGLGPWLKAHCSEFWLAPFTLHVTCDAVTHKSSKIDSWLIDKSANTSTSWTHYHNVCTDSITG